MKLAEVGYAKRDGLHIAYQVVGDGPVDLLALTNGSVISIDRDDEQHWARFDRRLASFSRLIRFDPVGFGLSDPLPNGSSPTLERWVADARAVLDAVESSRTALFGVGVGGLVAMSLSATCPERVSGQVLMHTHARLARDADYPHGLPRNVLDNFVEAVTDPGFAGDPLDDVSLMAPSLATDVEFRSWWKQAGQRGACPANARAMNVLALTSDVRAVLPKIDTPTLVMHRRDNALLPIVHGRFLAENISGARLIELPGRDHLAFAGDTDELLAQIEEFLTGARSTVDTERTVATILFTDIVDSTKRAAGTGDRHWRELLENHDRMARRQVHRFGGRYVKTTGDGLLATFDAPARGIQCGRALCEGARDLGLAIRVGLHTGEVELRGDDVAGIGVHIASRVQSHAQPGEVWVSRTVADLVTGSGTVFGDRGEHKLKGVPGQWQLFALSQSLV